MQNFSNLVQGEQQHMEISLMSFTLGWWRGVVCNTFRMKQSYSTLGPVSTAMGDCLPARSTQPSTLCGMVK